MAYDNCHFEDDVHMKSILKLLIPLEMLHGRTPSFDLLKKYNLLEYSKLSIAVKEGNIYKFE